MSSRTELKTLLIVFVVALTILVGFKVYAVIEKVSEGIAQSTHIK